MYLCFNFLHLFFNFWAITLTKFPFCAILHILRETQKTNYGKGEEK